MLHEAAVLIWPKIIVIIMHNIMNMSNQAKHFSEKKLNMIEQLGTDKVCDNTKWAQPQDLQNTLSD